MDSSISSLTYGVEIECYSPVIRSAIATSLVSAGLQATAEIYNHTTLDRWKVITDGSLDDYNGVELVSPVLKDDEGLAQIAIACRVLNELDCRVTRRCGLHVHVGVADTANVGLFKELVKTYARFEPVIDNLVAPSRRANSYCKPLGFLNVDPATTFSDLRRRYGGDRYRKLNLEAFLRHGTVEFRQHQGTTNAEKIANWVRFCLRLVAHAGKNTELDSNECDYDRAPTISSEVIRRGGFLRSRRYDLRIVAPMECPWRASNNGSRTGIENWDRYRDRPDLATYLQRGGSLSYLRYDIARGRVRVVDYANAPIFTAPFERPDTDAAPVTLEGLMNLIALTPEERRYFVEREQELNA